MLVVLVPLFYLLFLLSLLIEVLDFLTSRIIELPTTLFLDL